MWPLYQVNICKQKQSILVPYTKGLAVERDDGKIFRNSKRIGSSSST